jgi:hypothetical protein
LGWESTRGGNICGVDALPPEGDVLVLIFFQIYAKTWRRRARYQAPLGHLVRGAELSQLVAQLRSTPASEDRVAGQRTNGT